MARRAVQKAEEPHSVWGNDPAKYDGPLRRMDGARPYNDHFWPTTWYWLREYDRVLANQTWSYYIGRDNIGICQINTGEWLNTDGGSIHSPRFPTRKAAIEACAGTILSAARKAVYREKTRFGHRPLPPELYAQVVKWVAWVLAKDEAERASEPAAGVPGLEGRASYLDVVSDRMAEIYGVRPCRFRDRRAIDEAAVLRTPAADCVAALALQFNLRPLPERRDHGSR